MELQDIQDLITSGDIPKLIEGVRKNVLADFKTDERLREYEPGGHKILDVHHRPLKKITSIIKDEEGKDQKVTEYREVGRVPLALQKLITDRRSMFITGAGVELEAAPEKDNAAEETLLGMVEKVIDDIKLKNKYSTIATTQMTEGECAVLFYLDETDSAYWNEYAKPGMVLRPRMVILKPSNRHIFYPVFDQYENMVAFGREFKLGEVRHLHLYTSEFNYTFVEEKGNWVAGERIVHGFDRIPVAYFYQEKREWQDVQWAIERLEDIVSNHADTNDYFSAPILLAKGTVKSMVDKKSTGKMLELDENADAKYLEWNSAPESIKLEIENLLEFIYTTTRTPDISFGALQGVGNVTGVALRLMFLDAHAAAKEHQEGPYGESVQRMVNIIKAGCIAVDQTGLKSAANMPIKVKFDTYIPMNEREQLENNQILVNTIASAVMSDLMSRETGVKAMPVELVPDTDAEMPLIAVQRVETSVSVEGLSGF